MPVQQTIDDCVVDAELVSPMRIAVSAEQLGGANDIGEQDSREHSLRRIGIALLAGKFKD